LIHHAAPFGAEEFAQTCGVSRETLARLAAYAALLEKWQGSINLVARSTLADLWRRHFYDSAQILALLPPTTRTLVDFGSGAGLPGLVLAILGVPNVHLIESDQRKCAFLREASRITGTNVQVHARTIESAPPFPADAITARALAPLDRLLELAERFSRRGTVCVFHKGRGVEDELTAASKTWIMKPERVMSRTDPSGTILVIRSYARAGGQI
jgi:16S rRNA (guanine527-N7)-methyltransferase